MSTQVARRSGRSTRTTKRMNRRGATELSYDAVVDYADDCALWATMFIDNLEDLGLRVWHRNGDEAGESFDQEAREVIQNGAALIQIVSPGAFCSLEIPEVAEGKIEKFVPVIVSEYSCPAPRMLKGHKSVRLVTYDSREYAAQLVKLACQVLRKRVPVPVWKDHERPPPLQWPVEAALWNRALDVAEFVASFAILWQQYEVRHNWRGAAAANMMGVGSARMTAHQFLYGRECHKSVKCLAGVLNEFRPGIERAGKLANFGKGGSAWWEDACSKIEEAARSREIEDDIARRGDAQREVADEEAYERSVEVRMLKEQEEIEAARAAEAMKVTEDTRTLAKSDVAIDDRHSSEGDDGVAMADPKFLWDFFFAHAGADKAAANELYDLLSDKYKVFLDTKYLLPGDDWDREIGRAQRAARVSVVLVSKAVDHAYYEREEIAAAIALARVDGQNHRVVPVYLDGMPSGDCAIPYGLRLKHGIDAGKEGGMVDVAAVLKELMARLAGMPTCPETSVIGRPVTPDSPSSVAASTLTWEGLDFAESTYQVNPFDDVVLCMHPDATAAWRDVIPNARTAEPPCIVIQTPGGAWHREELDSGTWRIVFTELEQKLTQARTVNAKRIHVLAMAPFSLGALIGARLDPQNYRLIVYQQDNEKGSKEQKRWRPWGPEWPAPVGTRLEDFFNSVPGLEHPRPERDGDIALIVDITGRSNPDSCVAAVRAHRSHLPARTLILGAKMPGQGAIVGPADVDKASAELARSLQQISEMLPNATFHLFYYGPLAILIRASRSLCLRRTPTIIYEAIYPDGNVKWIPAVAFPKGELLVGK